MDAIYNKHIILHLALVIIGTFFFFVFLGMNVVLFPYILHSNNVSSTLIGLSGSFETAASLVIVPAIPFLARKTSPLIIILTAAVVSSIVVLLLPFYQSFFLWIVLVVLIGSSWFSFLTLSDAWLHSICHDTIRGKVSSIISSVRSLAMALAPLLINFIGIENYDVFIVSSSICLLTLIPFAFLRAEQPLISKEQKINFKGIFLQAPVPIIGNLLGGFVMGSMYVLAIAYCLKNDIPVEKANILISTFLFSSLFYVFLGVIVDRLNKVKTLLVTSIVCIFLLLSLPLLLHEFWILKIHLFVFGLFIGLLSITLIALLNSSFSKSDLVSANSVFHVASSFGAIIGAAIIGHAMDLFPKFGLPVILSFGFGLYAAYLLINFCFKQKQ